MAILSSIKDIVAVCAAHGVKQVVICPGSRNAALTIYFTEHPAFDCYSISDERSAAYIALGMAQETNQTVALICTSGTAALNFAPAIAEAFFLEVPLLVLTADRPAEWINQYDGQTIFQGNLYGKHVKNSYELLAESETKHARWFTQRTVNEALALAVTPPMGPVHINVPIREPFYPTAEEVIHFDSVKIIQQPTTHATLAEATWRELVAEFSAAENILVAIGQQTNDNLSEKLSFWQQELGVAVLADIISNIPTADIKTQDEFLASKAVDPIDLLITSGKSFISKEVKIALRKNPPKFHWHIQETSTVFDPFQSMTRLLRIAPSYFFEEFPRQLMAFQSSLTDLEEEREPLDWVEVSNRTALQIRNFLAEAPFSDQTVVWQFIKSLPDKALLHLGNSMSVRYANSVAFELPYEVKIFCNRGTSGIDGCVSTAVGAALTTSLPVYCLVGDVSFQYDKNALWNNYLPPNLKIIVLNNGGGTIFRMIAGPKQQNAFDTYFETKQKQTAAFVEATYGVTYFSANSMDEFLANIAVLAKSNSTALLEVFTESKMNEEVFRNLKNLQIP